jgi:flagellar biosynthetic protein FliO
MNNVPGSETISAAALGLDVLFKLGIVVLLIYASLYLLKRLQAGTAPGSRKRLAILETARLSSRQALHLVKVGDQVLLIGATDQSVNYLLNVEGAMQSIEQVEGAVKSIAGAGISDAGIERVGEPALSLSNASKVFGPVAAARSNFAAFLMDAFGKR